jgi:alkylated DNA repair dioxygenase AlkB
MPQLSLFQATESVLADDERGRIAYTRHFVPASTAQAWFEDLLSTVPWKAERRRMYDRDVDVPRLTAHFSLPDPEVEAASAAAVGGDIPAVLLDAARGVRAQTAVPYTSVGLNLYRDGRDSVAPHNDHLDVLVEGFPIALLSLGATRTMTIRAKEPPRRVLRVALEPGSLLLMSYATQLHYTHGVPKTPEAVGARISLAFRVKPSAEDDDERGRDPYR